MARLTQSQKHFKEGYAFNKQGTTSLPQDASLL